MAVAKSIDDIFSSEVDEKEVNALIGSLETKLAPQNPKARTGPQQEAIVNKNHVNDNATLHAHSRPVGLAALQAEPGVTNTIHGNAVRQSSTAQELHLGNSGDGGNHNHEKRTNSAHQSQSAPGNGQNSNGLGSTVGDGVKQEVQPPVISNMTKPPTTMTTVPVAQQSPAIVAQIQAQSQGIGLAGAKVNNPAVNITASPLNKDAMGQLRTSATASNDQQIVKVVSMPSAVTSTSGAGLSEAGANLNSVNTNNASNIGGTAKEQLLVRQQQAIPSNDPSGAIKPRIIVQPSVAAVQQTSTPTISGALPPGSMTVGNPSQKVVTINVANPALSGVGRPGQYVVNTVSGAPKGQAVSPHVITQTVRMPGAHQVIAPRAPLSGQVQIRLPPGTSLPPGVVLINKGGTVQAVMGNSAAIQAHGVTYRHVQPGAQVVTSSSQPSRVLSSVAGASGGATAIVSNPHIAANTSRAGSPVVISSSPAAIRAPAGASPPVAVQQVTPGKASATKGSTARGGAGTGAGAAMSSVAIDNVKKCKNFLTTLIKLASQANQPPQTVQNVKTLVQSLIDAKIEPEEFTLKLQKELNSSPQPYLVPFLKRSLPLLRQSLRQSSAGPNINTLMGPLPPSAAPAPTPPPVSSSSSTATPSKPPKSSSSKSSSHSTAPSVSKSEEGKEGKPASSKQASQKSSKSSKNSSPGRSPSPSTKSSSSKSKSSSSSSSKSSRSSSSKSGSSKSGSKSTPSRKDKNKDTSTNFSTRDDDDINDVASMAGVNLSEESARILATNEAFVGTQLRSCEDQKFLHLSPLQHRMSKICTKHGVKDATPAVLDIVSLAVQERLKQVVEKLSVLSQHRLEIYRSDPRFEVSNDVRSQMKFFEQLDSLERKRRDEQEREMLLRAAKSRSKQEDPEQLRLKQKAKEMQQMELEQLRQQEANLTALAAIGPRKKRKLDTEPSTSAQGGASGSSSLLSTLSSPGSNTTPFLRTTFRRTKRVNMKDLLYLLEQEPETRKSPLLYKMYLK